MKYYYTKLDNRGKSIYKEIYYGIKNFETKILLDCDKKLARSIFDMVIYDNPLLFYVNPYELYFNILGTKITLNPRYLYSKDEADEMKSMMKSKLKSFGQNVKLITSELEKERYIHKFLVANLEYAEDKDNIQVHTIVGSILYKNAVCDGISKAFKLLCDIAKIECNILIGDAWNEYKEPEKHAWNMVKIDNNWYHIDVTWDLCLSKMFKYIRYDYFNLNYTDISKDHINFEKLEVCDKLHNNYFYDNSSEIHNEKELEAFFIDKVKRDSESIYFKFKYNEENPTDVIYKCFFNAYRKLNKRFCRYVICPNKTQDVYLIKIQ